MSLEEKINFVEGENNQVSNVPVQDPFSALTGQAPNTIEEAKPTPELSTPADVAPTLSIPNTPHHNYVPGIKDYVEAMDIDQMFPDKYIPGIDPDIETMINDAAAFMNHHTQSLDNTTPYGEIGPAMSGYDPITQMSGQPDFNTTSGRNTAIAQAFQQATINSPEIKNPGYQDPFGFSLKGQNMDRYLNHPKYDQLGFNVFADNEKYYNQRSGWGHDLQRTSGQWFEIFGTAFGGTYRSIGDVFIGDFSMGDKQAARTMENSMRIAASTRGGIGGFVNDFGLNSAYTISMLASIVAEEALFAAMAVGGTALFGGSAAATGATGGTSAPVTGPGMAAGAGLIATGVAGILRNIARIPKAFSISKRLKAAKEIISSLSDAATARKWYDAAKAGKKGLNGLFKFLSPETVYALKNLTHAKSAGQNILNLAHGAKTFGAFYRDVRMYNMALSESKLEGAMVENQVFEQLYKEWVDREGRAPTKDELNMIKYNSSRAGLRTLQANFPVIFLSNKIVFEHALGGIKPIQRMINEARAGVGKRIFDTGKRKGTKGFKKGDRYKKLSKKGSWWDIKSKYKRAKERGWKGNMRYLGAGAFRATPPAFVEGMQEVYQESIAHATEQYFGDIYAEEIRTGQDLLQMNLGKENFNKDFWTSLGKGAKSQFFTPEGASVFMSGFLMGGVMGPSSKFFFETVPNMYRAKSDPIKYQEYKKQKEKLEDQYVQLMNDAYENPLEFLDPAKMNSATQKQVNRRMKQASLEGDMLDFFDAQQDGLFSQLNMLYETGRLGEMERAIDDYMAMDDATLKEAFSDSEYIQEDRVDKFREKLKEAKEKAKEIQQNQDKFRKMFPGKARPQDYKWGSQEWVQQVILQQMENHARNLIIYNKSEMLDSAKRMEEIMEWAVQQGPLADMDSATLMVLQGKNKMKEEIQRLKDFVALNAMTPQEKKAKANAKKKLKALKNLNDVLFAPENQVAKVNATEDYVTPEGKKIYELDKEGNRIPVVVDGVVQKDKKGNIIYKMLQVAKDPSSRSVGGYNKSPQYIKKLRKPFINYLKTVAEIEGKTLEVDKVDSMLKKIVDYGYLNNRIGDYQAALDILMDQDFFYDTAGRLAYNANRMWKKYKNSHHKRIKAYVEKHGERVAFLKALATYTGPGGPIFPDPDEVENFLSKDEITTFDIPSTFYQEDGMVMPGKSHPDTIAEIKRLIQVQERLIRGEHIKDESTEEIEEDVENVLNIDEDLVETEEEKEEVRQNKKSLEEFYEDDSETGANTRAILEREYNKYNAISAFDPFTFTFDIWKAHPKLGRKIVQARMMAYDIWSELKEDKKKEFENFDDWLIKNIRKNSRLNSEIFEALKINPYSIINKVVVDQNIMPGVIDPNKDIILHKDLNKGLFLIKYQTDTVHPTTGKVQYAYKIINAEGTNAFDLYRGLEVIKPEHPIRLGWSNQSEALKAYENLLLSIPSTKTYKFDGMEIKQGEIFVDKDGRKYIVATNATKAGIQGFINLKPVGEAAKDITTWKKLYTQKQFKDEYKRFKEDFSKLNLDKGKQYKLNLNYPIQFWANPKYGTGTKEEFQDFLRGLSPQQKESLEIVIKRNPEFDVVTGSDPFVFKDGSTNNYIKRGAPKFIVTIMNGPQEVARLQGFHDMVLIDPKSGERIIPKNMTMEQMEEIFNLTYVGPRYNIKTKQDALEHVKNVYKQGQIIDEIFSKVLKDETDVSINLFDIEKLKEQLNDDNLVKELQMLSLAVSPGNPAFTNLDDKGKPTKTSAKTKFEDIRYKTFRFEENDKGELIPVGLDSNKTDDGFFYVINNKWTISEDEGYTMVQRYKTKEPPIHNINTETEDGAAMFDAIQKAVEKAEKANKGFTVFNNLGRYTLVSILPNGQITFVELQATEYGEAKVDELVANLKEQQKKNIDNNLDEKNEPKDPNYNDLFNQSINNQLYITGKPSFAFGYPQAVSFDIGVSQYGKIVFTYTEMPGTKQQVSGSIGLTAEDMKDVNNAKDLIAKIKDKFSEKQNKLVKEGKQDTALTFDLDVSSFKNSIPDGASTEEMQTTTGTIRPEVRTNISLTLNVNNSDYFQMHKNTEVSGKDTIENKEKEREEVKEDEVDLRVIDNAFLQEYDPELGGKGWYQVPTAILQMLTNKLGDVEGATSLTLAEKVVIDSTNLMQRIEQGEFKKEIKKLSVNDKQEQLKLKKQQIKVYKQDQLNKIKQDLNKQFAEGKMTKPEKNITYLQRKMQFLDNDPGLLALEQELAEIENTKAFKITDNFDGTDVEDINIFINWAKNNLPEFIGIEDINTLQDRLKNKGVTLGMFMMELQKVSGGLKFLGKIYTSPTSGYRYHEAFHSVFRMLLTDQEISLYLDIAKKEVRSKLRKEGKTLKSELEKMRMQSPIYSTLSEKALEERYYEEYLADRFQDFKQNPKNKNVPKGLRGFFNKVIEWIKSVFEKFSSNQTLNKLFKDIDSGKYRNLNAQDNRFTNAISSGVAEPVFKIKIGTTTVYKNVDVNGKLEAGEVEQNIYLSPSETNKLKNSIGGLYLRRLRNINGEYIPSKLLDETINDYIQMYNPARPFYINEENGIPYEEVEEELFEKFEALNDDDVKKEIAKEINGWLNLFDMKIDLEQDQMAYNLILENQEGGDSIPSVGDWDMQTNEMGGFKNLPQALREFIATTTIEEKDEFGNEYVPSYNYKLVGDYLINEKESRVQTVDYITAYNGLLKAVAGKTTALEILQGFVLFSQTSVHSKAVIERFFREMGISNYNKLLDTDASLPIDEIESANPAQFNQIIKSLQQFTVDYMFIEKNTKQGKTLGHVDVYAANHKDDAHDQINKWNSAYDVTYWKRRNSKSVRSAAVRSVNLLHSELNNVTRKSIDDSVLLNLSSRLSEDIFNTTGIKLSRGYIRFSILNQIKKNAGIEPLSPSQEALLRANKDVEFITAEDVSYWSGLLDAGVDLFANFNTKVSTDKSKDKDNSETKSRSGIQSRLKKFARGNAIFDETVGTTVFRDPEGNLIYSHQLPTFHLEAIKELNGGTETTNKLKTGYNANNNLLQDESSFINLSENGKLTPLRISGQKQVVMNVDSNNGDVTVIESDGTKGVTYGNSTPADMLASVINTTLWNFNSANGVVKTVTDKFGKEVAIVPSLIRVMEASNTGDFIGLGSVHSVEYIDQKTKEFKLTDEYVNRHINNIENEYNRIYFQTEQIEDVTRDRIKGFNDVSTIDEVRLLDDDPTKARAFKLTNTGDLVTKVIVDKKKVGKRTKFTLDDTIKQELEDMARQGVPFEQAMKELPVNLKDLIVDKLNFEFDQFMEIATELGVLDKISTAFGSSLLTMLGDNNANITASMNAYNFKANDLNYNLAQIFHSDFINTVDINNLLLGDQAVSLKDSIDKIKRAKAQNAAGPNAQSVVGWRDKGIEPVSKIDIITHEDPTHDSPSGDQNTMDAQIYMTLKGLKHTQFAMGRLTTAQLKVIETIESGEKVNWYDWFGDPDKGSQGLKKGKGALNSQKYVYADGVTYLKMSVVPLIREEVSYRKDGEWIARKGKEKLHNLLDKMEAVEAKGTIMMSVPETASKMMKKNVLTESEVFESDKALDANGPLQTIEARYLRLQQVNPFGKTEVTDVRQMKQLILSEQVDSTPVVIRGNETTVGQLRSAYQKLAGDKFELAYLNKRNLVFKQNNQATRFNFTSDNKDIDVDLFSVLQYSINALEASKSKQQMVDFFEVDETGNQKFNLNNPITRQQFEEKYFSFWQDVFAQKQPGTSYTLKSSYGHKVIKKVVALDPVTKQPIRWEVLRNDDYVAMDLRGEAPIIAKENYDNETDRTFVGLKEGEYYLDDLRHDVMEYDENNKPTGQRYSEFIAPPQFSSAIRFIKEGQPIPDVIAKQFGTRVPSQDKHSSINLKLVDFSPVYLGNSAIFTRELIEISGADFDIDQLYTQFKQFFVEKKVVKSGEQIEQEWEEWAGTPQWSPKAKTNIIRIDRFGEDFDVVKSKKEFAAAKRKGDLTYNPMRDDNNNLIVQQSSTDKQSYGKNNQYRYDETTGEFSDIIEGNVVEYGSPNLTLEQEYNEYLRYIVGEAGKPGSTIFLAINKWNSQMGVLDKIQPKDITVHASSMLSDIQKFVNDNLMIFGALESIGLPTSLSSYKQYKNTISVNPNMASTNNMLLDYKFGLLGNKGVSEALPGREQAIKNEPANLSPLTDPASKEGVLEVIQELIPELKEMIDQGKINVDNLFGKIKVFESNKEGASSIGAAVLPNVVVNVLQMYDIKLQNKIDEQTKKTIDHRLKFNGLIFDSFGNPYIKDDAGKPDIQKRKQHIISALITAMTDNAKEQLAAKLGLNKDALAIVVNMTALSIPIRTSILLVKNPSIQEAYKLAKNKKKETDPGVDFYIKARLDQLSELTKDSSLDVTDNTLVKSLKKFTKSGYQDPFSEEYTKELTSKEVANEIAILNEFRKARNVKNYSAKAQSLITLLAGVGRDLSSVTKRQQDFFDLGIDGRPGASISNPFDMTPVVSNTNDMLGRYLKYYKDYVKLLPNVFITETKDFKEYLNGVLDNLATGFEMTDAKRQKVINDILSILTLKAYEYQLGLDVKIRPSLSNSMLYKSTEGVSINDVLEEIKEKLGDKENDFINFYVEINDKNPGVDLLEANTWATLSDSQFQDIQLSFLELFKDENTRDLAYDIIHYAMIKDGLQNRVSSLIKALPADMLDGPINAIGRVDDYFKGKVESSYENVFGISKEQLLKEFDKYFEHISNGTILPKVRSYHSNSKETLKNAGLKRPPVIKSKNILMISGLNGIKQFDKVDSDIKTVYIDMPKGKKVEDMIKGNTEYLNQMGWKANITTVSGLDNKKITTEISFPKVIVRTESTFVNGNNANVEVLYKLDRVYKIRESSNDKNLNELPVIGKTSGIGAVYKVMEGLKGTKDQYGGGTLVTGNVPLSSTLNTKQSKTGKDSVSTAELKAFKAPGQKAFNPESPNIKEINITNKGIKLVDQSNASYSLDTPSALKGLKLDGYQPMKKAETKESSDDIIKVKKDDVSSWKLRVDPKTGAVTNVNTGKKLNPRKDSKLINKAHVLSGYVRYTKVKVKGKDYLVTSDGKVINAIPGSKNQGVAVKKTSALYAEAVKLAAQKKAKEDAEIPSIEEAIEIIQRQEEDVTVTKEDIQENVKTEEEAVEEEKTLDREEFEEISLNAIAESLKEDFGVEEEPTQQLDLFGGQYTITPLEKKFIGWWDSLNIEQQDNIVKGAFENANIKSGMDLITLMRDLKIEASEKTIENLKCYI